MKALQFLFILGFLSFSVKAQDPKLDSAKSQYDQSRYIESIASYENIISQDLGSAELYFNLGNAYYRTGDIGRSILNFEKALKESPGDDDIQFNLKLANTQKKDVFESIPSIGISSLFSSINTFIHFEIWAIISCLLFLTAGVLFFLSKKEKAKSFKRISFIMIASALLIGIISIQQKKAVLNNNSGIIIQDQSNIFSEPNINSTLLLEVNSGTKLRILNETNGWIEVQSPSNDKGWIQNSNLESI